MTHVIFELDVRFERRAWDIGHEGRSQEENSECKIPHNEVKFCLTLTCMEVQCGSKPLRVGFVPTNKTYHASLNWLAAPRSSEVR